MVKSSPYIGLIKQIKYRETLTNVAPEVKAQVSFAITHNTNVVVDLTSNQITLDLSAWNEAADFNLKIYSIPRENPLLADDGVVTLSLSQSKAGKIVVAGYTTAVVQVAKYVKVTLTASKYGSVKRLVFKPCRSLTYRIAVTFTDRAGVAQAIAHYIDPDEQIINVDLRKYDINRAIDLVISYTVMNSNDSVLVQNAGAIGATGTTEYNDEPIELSFDVNNSIDEMSPGSPMFLTESSIISAENILTPYSAMIQLDAQTMSKPIREWIRLLSQAVAYSISKGWTSSQDWNSLEEIRTLSKQLVGAITAIVQGNLSDPLIPEHFSEQISEALNSNTPDLFEKAALWAVVDNTNLELSF